MHTSTADAASKDDQVPAPQLTHWLAEVNPVTEDQLPA